MPVSLGELATRFGCELIGDPDTEVSGVASLPNATGESLTFLASTAYKAHLSSTKAAAVILKPADAADSPVAVLVHENPYACYARMAAFVCPEPAIEPGIHASAVIDPSAKIAASAHIGPQVAIGARTIVGDNVYVGPGTVIGPDCVVDENCRLIANVTLARAVRIGKRGIIHPGAILGSDGFGQAQTPDGWIRVPQLGGLRVGDDVEIGANTTVDCGAIDDTVIEDGVRIDNLCQIGHNVHVGAHTAMASGVAIAGSTIIGERCQFAGRVASAGHLHICDDVVALGRATITKSITKPGTYGAVFPAEPATEWAKHVARFRRIGALIERVRKLEGK